MPVELLFCILTNSKTVIITVAIQFHIQAAVRKNSVVLTSYICSFIFWLFYCHIKEYDFVTTRQVFTSRPTTCSTTVNPVGLSIFLINSLQKKKISLSWFPPKLWGSPGQLQCCLCIHGIFKPTVCTEFARISRLPVFSIPIVGRKFLKLYLGK